VTTFCITIAQLNKLEPCAEDGRRVRKALRAVDAGKAKCFTASEAKAAGCTLYDVCWVASAHARGDKATERALRMWMADCAARVLHIANDPRSTAAVVAARQFANGEIDAAAWAAARAAAWAAARAAASDAEEAWQFDRLCLWLSDDQPEPWPIPALAEKAAA
jgi:hypothetical protein